MEGLENVTRSRVELAVKFRLDGARIRLQYPFFPFIELIWNLLNTSYSVVLI